MVQVSTVRTVAVDSGAAEYLRVDVTELNGLTISGDTFSMALVPANSRPSSANFVAPTLQTGTGSTIQVAMLVNAATVGTRGQHDLWIKVLDTGEVVVLRVVGSVELV